ncbi:SDR family oxidoreductase [Candidatus Woesearchaeota archaeon]|nr:MAG: SDR family oxidoreductase [Candidatus Woesearchaeota archaeon]
MRKPTLKGKKIIITGGAGFIGSNLARELCKDNKVTVIDNFSTGRKENLKGIESKIRIVKGSITNLKLLRREFKGADYVLHQAALCSVPRSVKEPEKTNRVNVEGTLKVLLAARDSGVKRVVYAASSSAYGNTPTLPKHEGMKPEPLSPYAVSKLAGEHYMRAFYEVYGLETISLRYFNIFGPHQDPNSQYSAVIPLFIKALLRGKKPTIYGDGKQSRDFTYVENVVNANILACKARKTKGEVVNIACGERITLLELVRELNRELGTSIKPAFGPERAGDVKHSLADITLAKKLIGYEPVVKVKEGLKRTIEFYKKEILKDKKR